MSGKFFFHILLLILPCVASAQSTAKEWYEKGIELKEKQDYENALLAFKNAISKDAKHNEAYYEAGWCCNELEKFEEAVDYLRKYEPTSNENKKIKYNELGYSYFKLQNSKAAIEQYKQILSIFPGNSNAFINLGNVYYSIDKDYDEAILYYEKALKADEEGSSSIYYEMGWIYNDKGRYDDAVKILLKAIEHDSEDSEYREELGYAYYKKEEYEFAFTQLNKAISLNEKSIQGYYYKGLCFVATNKKGEAMSIYYKLKEMESDEAGMLLEKINKMNP